MQNKTILGKSGTMDVKEFMESGVLEEYCLGLLNDEDQAFVIQMAMLYPEVKRELTEIELSLEKFAGNQAVEPRQAIKHQILSSIAGTIKIQSIDLNDLPEIGLGSDYQSWYRAVEHLVPAVLEEDFFCRALRQDEHITQMLIVTKTDVMPETHTDLLESFLILKGTCRCTVGDKIVDLSDGGFIEIPLHIEHDVRVLSPYVVAILQYLAV